jgi:hypothetical protein
LLQALIINLIKKTKQQDRRIEGGGGVIHCAPVAKTLGIGVHAGRGVQEFGTSVVVVGGG